MEKKISIHITSEKERAILMDHFEDKGWICSHKIPINIEKYPYFNYRDDWNAWSNAAGEDVISFSAFATPTGIELPADEVVIELEQGVTKAVVTIGKVQFKNSQDKGVLWLSHKDITEIAAALESLGEKRI